MNALAHAAGPAVAPPVVHRVLASPGRPLDVSVRAEMEPRFRHSFADVRVHADGQAARSADAVAAHAYTVGRNVVFAAGRYAPSSAGGKTLIAHELAHVVQQRGAPAPSSRLEIGAADDAAEREADAAAEGRGMARAGTGGGAMLRRRPGYLVSHTFLGWNCGGGVNRGVLGHVRQPLRRTPSGVSNSKNRVSLSLAAFNQGARRRISSTRFSGR